ncbi:MAG: hypothetical protein FJ104_06430 [Deltaproteobacteria bacterium]|nr:hypothetical protein [Deltaproteobacteria bacterium]
MEDWTPLSIGVAALVGVVLGVLLLVRKIKQDTARLKARFDAAAPAEARAVQVGRSLLRQQQGTANIRLRLEITPRDGEPFQTTVTWDVEIGSIPKVQEGKQVPVKVDLEESQVVYPRVGWATYSWVYSEREGKGRG